MIKFEYILIFGAWSALTNYVSNDLVYNENGIFKCIANNINSIPTINNVTNWKCIFNSISISDTIFEDLTTSNKILVGATNLARMTVEEIAIATNKGWTVN